MLNCSFACNLTRLKVVVDSNDVSKIKVVYQGWSHQHRLKIVEEGSWGFCRYLEVSAITYDCLGGLYMT